MERNSCITQSLNHHYLSHHSHVIAIIIVIAMCSRMSERECMFLLSLDVLNRCCHLCVASVTTRKWCHLISVLITRTSTDIYVSSSKRRVECDDLMHMYVMLPDRDWSDIGIFGHYISFLSFELITLKEELERRWKKDNSRTYRVKSDWYSSYSSFIQLSQLTRQKTYQSMISKSCGHVDLFLKVFQWTEWVSRNITG